MNPIEQLEQEIREKTAELNALRKAAAATPVTNYTFQTLEGNVTLRELFAGKSKLFAIHNMGQGCRYCTLWADGLNAIVPHLESEFAVVLLSKDPPAVQRRFANGRGWRFRMASHGGGDYIREQSVIPGRDNVPGMVCYERDGEQVMKRNSTVFGPGDLFCPLWHILGLGGVGLEDWTPQFSYWHRPPKLDDGGLNVIE